MFDIKRKRTLLSGGAFFANLALTTCLATPAYALSGGAAPAAFAPSDGGDVSDIVVTAEHRKSSLQSTALAISVLPAATLDRANIQNISDLSGYAPGLTITKTGGIETTPAIRGIGANTPENTGSTAPGVSMFIDGVYIGDSLSLGQDLFDLDHLEVLRGPQGTLYGVSSIGGALILVSKQPTLDKFGADVDVSGGNYDFVRARGALNIPLSETMALRVSAQHMSHEGFTVNTVSPHHRLDDADETSAKAALLWQPAPNFSATLTGQWYRKKDNGPTQKGLSDPNPDPRVISQDYLGFEYYNSKLVHLNLKWDLPALSLSSVTGYRTYKSNFAENVTFTTFDLYSPYENVPNGPHNEKVFTQEFDVLSPAGSRLNWTAGIFFMRRTAKSYIVEYQGTDPSDPQPSYVDPAGPIPGNLAYGNATTDIRTVVEPFVQFTYPITETLRLTGGARYNYEKHDHRSLNFSEFGVSPVFRKSDETKLPTWRVQLSYDATPSNMLYASVATGYKAGGVNGNAGPALLPQTFKDERNTAFEIGSKNEFLDRKLRLNVAAFYYIYKDMQYIETDPIPFDQGITNIPLIHMWGGEAEASYSGMGDRLHVNANLTVQHGEVVGDTNVLYPSLVNGIYASAPGCAFGGQYYNPACWAAVIAAAHNIKGNRPPGMPTFSGSFDISYDFKLAGGTVTPWFQFLRQGTRQARIFNEAVLDREAAYNILNFSISYQPNRSRLRFNLAVSNLADKAGVNSRYTSPYESGLTSQQFTPPRQVIGTVAYSF
jgi:iron complex outermembrane receptor protein